jgi:CRP-like cAMP-binding protein
MYANAPSPSRPEFVPQAPLNLFLRSLSDESCERLVSLSCRGTLEHHKILYEPDKTPGHAYFLDGGIASIVVGFGDGDSAEVGLTGREGVVGALHLLGAGPNPTHAVIQVPGFGLRVRFAELKKVFDQAQDVRDRILELIQYQHAIAMQVSACNLLHEVEPKLARWLLMLADRTGSDVLPLTQEFISQMLGTRRTTVSVVAANMQRAGLIQYQRGTVHLLDRAGLERASCDCYGFTRRALESLYQ